jgi:hypothetical protein
MKKYLSICLLAAALVLPAHAGLGYGGGVVIPGGGSSAGAVTTNSPWAFFTTNITSTFYVPLFVNTNFAGYYDLVSSNNHVDPTLGYAVNWMIWKQRSWPTNYLSLNDPGFIANFTSAAGTWTIGISNDASAQNEFYNVASTAPFYGWVDQYSTTTPTSDNSCGWFIITNNLTVINNHPALSPTNFTAVQNSVFVDYYAGNDGFTGTPFDPLKSVDMAFKRCASLGTTNLNLASGVQYQLLASETLYCGSLVGAGKESTWLTTSFPGAGNLGTLYLGGNCSVADLSITQLGSNLTNNTLANVYNCTIGSVSGVDALYGGNCYGAVNFYNCTLIGTYDLQAFFSGSAGTLNFYGGESVVDATRFVASTTFYRTWNGSNPYTNNPAPVHGCRVGMSGVKNSVWTYRNHSFTLVQPYPATNDQGNALFLFDNGCTTNLVRLFNCTFDTTRCTNLVSVKYGSGGGTLQSSANNVQWNGCLMVDPRCPPIVTLTNDFALWSSNGTVRKITSTATNTLY